MSRLMGLMADFEDLLRQRDIDRADGLARPAGDAQTLRSGGVGDAVVKRRVDQADCTRVDVAEGVAADDLVGRTDIGAGAAANAAQGVADDVALPHGPTPVVEQDDMHLLAGLGSGDAGRIGAQRLRGGRTGQELQLSLGVCPGRDQLLNPGSDEVDIGQRGREAHVALVGHDHDAAGFGNQSIRAGQSGAG